MKKRVVILEIENYNTFLIKEKINEVFNNYFMLDEIFSKQDKILLKPNLLMPATPDDAITTHPSIVEAVGSIFKERGHFVFVADCPGGFSNVKDLDYIYEKTQIDKVSKDRGFKLLYPDKFIMRNNFPLCWWIESFKLINLAKLKTHEIMVLTLATKNLYGCIYGNYKSYLHYKFPKTDDLVKVILNLYKTIKPSLNIVDGVVALEGRGPARCGKPKKLGLLFIGDDALYTDYVISKTLKLPDKLNPLIRMAESLGLFSKDNLEIISNLSKNKFIDFEFPAPFILNYLPSSLVSFLKVLLKFYPKINTKKCSHCLICKSVCPKGAIYVRGGYVDINLRKCIMCMSCVEVCNFGAIELDKSLILKIISALRKP